jgi:hypothetical protein
MGAIEFINGQPVEVEKIDLSQYDITDTCRKLNITPLVQSRPRLTNRTPKLDAPYVRQIPLSWAEQASHLPGKALHVGIIIWYLAGVSKSDTVRLTRRWLRRFGIHHETGRRALVTLEQADLIAVKRMGKKSPWVTLLKIPKAVTNERSAKPGL